MIVVLVDQEVGRGGDRKVGVASGGPHKCAAEDRLAGPDLPVEAVAIARKQLLGQVGGQCAQSSLVRSYRQLRCLSYHGSLPYKNLTLLSIDPQLLSVSLI